MGLTDILNFNSASLVLGSLTLDVGLWTLDYLGLVDVNKDVHCSPANHPFFARLFRGQ